MKNTILGAIVGDVIGSIYEWDNYRAKDFEFCSPKCDFTDDTVMTIAVAKSLMNNEDMSATLKDFGRRYPGRGYGGMFVYWLESENTKPYNSFGNGSAMRTSAAGFMAKNLSEAMILAEQSAIVTHNHSEGIKGAQATAVAIYLAKSGFDKDYIRDYITTTFEYNLDFTCDEIRDSYIFNETCQETVPQSIVAFLDSTDFEDAIRNAISIGGDSDTVACITGSIASAFYKDIPDDIRDFVMNILPKEFQDIILEFERKY